MQGVTAEEYSILKEKRTKSMNLKSKEKMLEDMKSQKNNKKKKGGEKKKKYNNLKNFDYESYEEDEIEFDF